MLNIQIVSDTHAEFYEGKLKFGFIKPSAPILALLGDICCCGSDEDFEIFKRFIIELLPQFEKILFIPGNHEYYYNPVKKNSIISYSNTYQGINFKINDFFKKLSPNLHFLNNKSMIISTDKKTNYLIVGSTLWSWIPEQQRGFIQNNMNDYQFIYVVSPDVSTSPTSTTIRKITATDIANIHVKNFRFIKKNITIAKKLNYKVCVLTHHKPYLSPTFNPLTIHSAYESNLSSLFVEPVVLWGYGHTHIADSTWFNKTLLFSNPKGYPSQKTKYNKSLIVSV